MQHDSSEIERDNSEMVRVNLNMGGGELRVETGTNKLAQADFQYNVPEWKPEVNYSASGGTGQLTISQGARGGAHIGLHEQNQWNVRLNRDIPVELTVRLGGGDAALNLGVLTVRGADVELGAGDLKMDLRGSPKSSYSVHVRGGAGDATIHLPVGVGVDATATGAVGEVLATGLHQDGHRYYNDALGKSPVTIHLEVEGGVGSIQLISSE